MSYTSLDFLGNTSSYLSIPQTSLSFGTGDFTIEWWQYEYNLNSFPRVFSIGNWPGATIAFDREGQYIYYWSIPSPASPSFSYDLTGEQYLNKWIHYAIVRNGGNITIYLNGKALTGTPFSKSENYNFFNNLVIGNETTVATNTAFKGQIYNFMWLIGTAKYTSDFTPSVDLPSDPSSYALVLNGSYSGGSRGPFVTNVGVGQSSNIPTIPVPPVPNPTVLSFAIDPNKRFSSISFGQFWYGNSLKFPGFLYKKNVGVGGRRSTKFAAGGNIRTNTYQYIYNKYKPGQSGIGATSIANRRAKNRLATVCKDNNCFKCYPSLGQYNNFLYNPNGYYDCLRHN